MSARELVVLGSASQVPTRERSHHACALRWDDELLLFDPGEGTQRQMLLAGLTASSLTRICITHFHGDHALGLPGVLQRRSLDRVPRPIDAHFPASGSAYFERLRHAVAYDEWAEVREHPVEGEGTVAEPPPFALVARRLEHRIDTFGYRLEEPGGRRMLPERLEARGVRGPEVGRLQREGSIEVGGRVVRLEEVSEPRPGQRFAFVMDTRLCDAAFELAEGVDLLVCEATFLDAEAHLAEQSFHLTARQAARIAAEAGARRLVLTHFSQRHPDERAFAGEAREVFADAVAVRDLTRVPLPPRS